MRWLVVVVCATTGCVGMSGIRNGPARKRMRAAEHVVDTNLAAGTQTIQRDDDVTDESRPVGFGVGMKMGVAYGGSGATSHGGYTQDINAYLVFAFGRLYVSPQLAFTMSLHGGSGMNMQGSAPTESGGSAVAVPLELEAGIRVADRIALYGAGGPSLWAGINNGMVSEHPTLWRGRGGGLFVLRNGDFEHKEITLRLEAFATTGSGDKLDYSAVGGLLQFDFTWTTSDW